MNVFPALAFRYYAYRRYYLFLWFPFFLITSVLLYWGKELLYLRIAAICFVFLGSFYFGAYEFQRLRHNYYIFRPSNIVFFLSSMIFSGINGAIQTAGMLAFLLSGSVLTENALLLPFVFLLAVSAFASGSVLALMFSFFGNLKVYLWILILGGTVIVMSDSFTSIAKTINDFIENSAFLLNGLPVLFFGSVLCFLFVYMRLKGIKK